MANLNNVKSQFKKVLGITIGVVLVVSIGIFSLLYFGTYSEGVRAGVVMKVSKRGVFFKTVEGQLNLQGFGAVKSDNQFSETFEFSIEKHESDLIKSLESVSLTGERINLKYKERYMAFPWRGETKYFVTGIERKAGAQAPENKTLLD